jgi:thymidylate kinase
MREFVLDPANNMRGETMELIFAAMRFENDLWLQKLQESENPPDLVISDRGYFDHLAYTDHNVSEDFTRDFYENFMAEQTTLPEVVIYFSVNTDTALKRRVKRGTGMDVIEMKGVEYQEKVRGSFEAWIDSYEGAFFGSDVTFYEVDANQSIEEVQKQLREILSEIQDYL